ncbi:hypothetical protein ACFV3E_44505 [Streptomyces sp. NPDC059718]
MEGPAIATQLWAAAVYEFRHGVLRDITLRATGPLFRWGTSAPAEPRWAARYRPSRWLATRATADRWMTRLTGGRWRARP